MSIGGASLIVPNGQPGARGGHPDADQPAGKPGDRRRLEPVHRPIGPRVAVRDLPAMESYMAEHPAAEVALDQPAYVYAGLRPAILSSCKALEVLLARRRPGMEAAQKRAER